MTECSRCGDCCENIGLNKTKKELREGFDSKSGPFILKHWHRSGSGGRHTLWTCDLFDKETRLCTAHDDRPAICGNFPYYGSETITARLPKRCSYWADLPAEQRPSDWQPVELRRAS